MSIQTMKKHEVGEQCVNGVNVSQLENTVQAIENDPELARFQFRARNKWVNGGYNLTTVSDYDGARQQFSRKKPFILAADEPPMLLGGDQATNPVEQVLAALAGCLTTSLVYHAAANGVEVEAVNSNYEGDLDLRGFLNLEPNIRKGYEEIRVRFRVKSDASEAQLMEFMKHSPVYQILTSPTPVRVVLEKS